MISPGKIFYTAAALAGLLLLPTQSGAAGNLLFIVDGSNSMWGQVNGTAKIQTAKDVLSDMLSDLPADTSVGLMAYGHRVEDDCTDVEILASIGDQSTQSIAEAVKSITPRGKTPIAHSIKKSAANFSGMEGQNNQVVLISDGIESCEGDPCAEAAALADKGIGVKLHVVGFDVDEETRAQLQCIAEKGKGEYFDARDADGFKEAIAEVRLASATTPEPAEPAFVEVFRDDFDGDDLVDHWEILNPDPDSY
ncbi:MAG: VWA domain-containing protein, partial [Pseudomonadota bacterium]